MRHFSWGIYALLLCLPLSVFGQVATGTIVGVVEDASGSVVPNSQTTVTHTATAETRHNLTNERGSFSFPYVRIGDYSVTAEAQGFKTKILTGIIVRVDQTVNIRLPLELGAVSESVEVSSAAPLIDTSTSSLGQVIDNKKVVDLPLNGRCVRARPAGGQHDTDVGNGDKSPLRRQRRQVRRKRRTARWYR
jgi:hypothetical protein